MSPSDLKCPGPDTLHAKLLFEARVDRLEEKVARLTERLDRLTDALERDEAA